MDRAGIVGEDSPTHHGALDCSYLRAIPGALIMAPRCANELRDMMYTALCYSGGPVFIRYPRGSGPDASLKTGFTQLPLYQPETLRRGGSAPWFRREERFCQCGKGLRRAWPNRHQTHPGQCPLYQAARRPVLRGAFFDHEAIVTVESNTLAGGFGSAVAELALTVSKSPVRILRLGYPDTFIPHGSNAEILKGIGLDAEGIAKSIQDFLKK